MTEQDAMMKPALEIESSDECTAKKTVIAIMTTMNANPMMDKHFKSFLFFMFSAQRAEMKLSQAFKAKSII